jgi:PAS domain S-box-containing protein
MQTPSPPDAQTPEVLARSLRALARATARLVARDEPQRLIQSVVESLVADFDSVLARIWLHDSPSGTLRLSASAGLSTRTTESARAVIDVATYQEKVGEVARTRRPFLKNSLAGEPGFDQEWLAREGISAVAVLPLVARDDLRGVLVHFTRSRICDTMAETLSAFAAIVAEHLERERLAHELERSRAEQAQAIETAEERLRMVVSHAPIILFALDPDGKITLSEGRGLAALGFRPGELVGRSVFELYPNAPDLQENDRRALAGEEFTAVNDVGGAVLETRFRPIKDRAGRFAGTIGVSIDVTETARLQNELQKAAKLESIGLLAAGIAHDFNNTLQAITANVSLAKLTLRPTDEAFAVLGEVEAAALRARELTNQLLVFAKGGAPLKRVSSIAGLIRDSASFALRGSNARLNLDLPPDLWTVDADGTQLGQVVQNLALNAQQAMPAGGVVHARAENAVLTEGERPELAPGRYVRIEISDTGVGIAPEHLTKIFDPFFTTKAGGTGLGLTMTDSVVKRHGGHVECRSEIGRGTSFTIWLPASTDLPQAPAEVREPVPHGRGRVLVMDDERPIRAVVGQILKLLGYEAEFAREGSEAVALYKRALASNRPFDVVLMDLTIPGGMGGRDAMAAILAVDPTARGIVSSGYSHDPVMAEFEKYGFRALIAKPYRLEDLARVLARVLAG